MLSNFIKTITSVKAAVTLISVIAFLCLCATLVPPAWTSLPSPLPALIYMFGFDNFFQSPLFLLLMLLFAVNITACTVNRLVKKRGSMSIMRLGPDVIHTGIILLLLGGLLSFYGRSEGSVWLSAGDSFKLPEQVTVELVKFEYLTYPDGRPREWISTLRVRKADAVIHESYALTVNNPFSVGKITIYQQSYDLPIVMSASDGSKGMVRAGDSIREGNDIWVCAGILNMGTGYTAAFERWNEHVFRESVTAHDGDRVGPFTVLSIGAHARTGLRASADPGGALAIPAMIIVLLGLCMTYLPRLKGEH